MSILPFCEKDLVVLFHLKMTYQIGTPMTLSHPRVNKIELDFNWTLKKKLTLWSCSCWLTEKDRESLVKSVPQRGRVSVRELMSEYRN